MGDLHGSSAHALVSVAMPFFAWLCFVDVGGWFVREFRVLDPPLSLTFDRSPLDKDQGVLLFLGEFLVSRTV